jgi:Protein of unknown function (DUF2946)
MKLQNAPLRWIAKFLLAAVLLQAMAPSWAVTKSQGSESLLEVCTAVGTQWVKQSTHDSDQPSVDHHSAHKHCVFCSSTGAADSFDASKLLVNHFSSEVPSRFTSLVVQLFSGHSILSRAPPV